MSIGKKLTKTSGMGEQVECVFQMALRSYQRSGTLTCSAWFYDYIHDDNSGTISFEEFLLLYRKIVAPQNQFGLKMYKAAGRGHCE